MAKTSIAARLEEAVKIHREIAAERYPNAITLGRLLGHTPKCIRHYIGILRDTFGLHPEYDYARHGFHYPEGSKAGIVPRLNEEEVTAVFLFEAATRHVKDNTLRPVINSVLGKLSLMLPRESGVSLDTMAEALSFRSERGQGLPASDPGILRTLHQAILRRNRVAIVYRSRSTGERTRRKVEPLHLTYCEGQWYLVAFCRLRKALRTFVPARIQQARPLEEKFTPPERFDPAEHFRSAFGIVAGYHVAEVSLRFDAKAAPIIRERQWHPTQIVEELPSGELRLKIICSHGEELKAWVLGWGKSVIVEAPKEFRREILRAHSESAGL